MCTFSLKIYFSPMNSPRIGNTAPPGDSTVLPSLLKPRTSAVDTWCSPGLSSSAELSFPTISLLWCFSYVVKTTYSETVKRICLHVMDFVINFFFFFFEMGSVYRGAGRLCDLLSGKLRQDGLDRPLGVLLAHKIALSAVCFFCHLWCVGLKRLQEEQWCIRVFWEYHYVVLPNVRTLCGGWCLD